MYIKYDKIIFLHFLDTSTLISCSILIFSWYVLLVAAATENPAVQRYDIIKNR